MILVLKTVYLLFLMVAFIFAFLLSVTAHSFFEEVLARKAASKVARDNILNRKRGK